MSDILKLQNLLKSLPSESNPAEKQIALFDANGEMSKNTVTGLLYKSIAGIESPGTILTLKEFIEKYLQGKRPPMVIGNADYATARIYYLQLTSTIKLNLQSYCALITKMPANTINSKWIQLSFIMFPTAPSESAIYIVQYQTDSDPSNPTIKIRKLAMEDIPL